MSDAELPGGALPGLDEVDQGNTDNDLEDEEIDLDDTLEWGQIDSPPAGARYDGTGSGDEA